MSISKEIIKWYTDNVMVHSCWENWDTQDFFEALKVIKKYEDKIKEPKYDRIIEFREKYLLPNRSNDT